MSQSLRVMVIDDNQDAADSLARLVRLWGHVVQVGYDESAVALAQEHQPEVILLDVGMPRVDGFTIARRLRETIPASQAIIIAVTGFHDEATERRCYESGFNHFLVKPVDSASLRALLDARLRARANGSSATAEMPANKK